jgi:glutathione S-transferase
MNVTKWLFWESAQFSVACLNLTYIYFHPAKQLAPEFLERYHLEFRNYAEILNTLLSEQRYIASDHISLADFSIASNLTYARVRGFPLDDFPNLARWFDEIEQRPSWLATTPKD